MQYQQQYAVPTMGYQERDFIPTGACVDEFADTFDTPAFKLDAQEACMSCIQLDNCRQQAADIAGVLAARGVINPVVGGIGYSPSSNMIRSADRYVEHGEATFSFAFQPLPVESSKQLDALRQARRTGQIYCRRPTQHPTIDVPHYFTEAMADDPVLLRYSRAHPDVVETLTSTLLYAVARRAPNGRMSQNKQERYRDFDPAQYVDLARLCVKDAVAIERLGIPGKRSLDHSPAFYERYLADGEMQGISRAALVGAARIASAHLLDRVEILQTNRAQNLASEARRHSRSTRIDIQADTYPMDMDKENEQRATLHSLLVRCRVLEIDAATNSTAIHPRLSFMRDYERDAIIYTYQLEDVIQPKNSLQAIEDRFGDVSALASVLLPYLTPDLLKSIGQNPALLPPQKVLEHVRQQLHSGAVSAHQRGSGANFLLETRDILASLPGFAPLTRDRSMLKGLSSLRVAAIRSFEAHNRELDKILFAHMAKMYAMDMLYMRQAKQGSAEKAALYFDRNLYDRITAYASTFCSDKAIVRDGFRNSRQPLKSIIHFVQQKQVLTEVLAEYDVPAYTIARLARYNKSAREAVSIAQRVEALTQDVHDVFSPQFIKEYAYQHTSSDFNALLRQKAATVRQLRDSTGGQRAAAALYRPLGGTIGKRVVNCTSEEDFRMLFAPSGSR